MKVYQFRNVDRVVINGGRLCSDVCETVPQDLGSWDAFPGWADSHCHILPTGLDLLKLNLSAARSRDEVLEMVRESLSKVDASGWLQAVHYDQNRFEDGIHLTRTELDRVSGDVPVLLRHVNGHASIANSAALRKAGVDRATPDPKGGEFGRDASGELNGVLFETAHELVTSKVPTPDLETMVEAILRAGEAMAAYGITCATDMMTGRWDLLQELRAYRLASERECAIRLRMYMQWRPVLGERGVTSELLQSEISAMNPELCKPLGLKIFADGAIGSATAAIKGVYTTTQGHGQLIYSPDRLDRMIKMAHENDWPLAIHSIGDASTDLILDSFEKLDDCRRHRIEHVMLLSDEQIRRIANLDCIVTMQPEFLVRFGHVYARQLGGEVATHLKRARSVIDSGIRLAFNSDRPIVEGDPALAIQTAVNRPDGFSSSENITLEEAEKAYSEMGAVANLEPGLYGTLAPGAFADLRLMNSESKIQKTVLGGDFKKLAGTA